MAREDSSIWQGKGHVGRQIVLPWSKAIEIAWKGISVRIWRSLIALSSIILAIAFLMSILTSTCLVASLSVRPRLDVREVDQAGVAARNITEAQLGDPRFAKWVKLMKEVFAKDQVLVLKHKTEVETKIDEIQRRAKVQGKMTPQMQTDLAKWQKELNATNATLAQLEAGLKKDGTAEQLAAFRAFLDREKKYRTDVAGAIDRMLQKEGHSTDEKRQGDLELSQSGSIVAYLRMVYLKMDDKDKWLASLALLVCLVGITNAMLMSVTERFREIGTMKCLGALDSFIVKLFLIESTFEGFAGTIVGVIIGFVLAFFRGLWAYGGYSLDYFPVVHVFYSGLFCLMVGTALAVVGALYPAQRAAKMEPVVAMRVEE